MDGVVGVVICASSIEMVKNGLHTHIYIYVQEIISSGSQLNLKSTVINTKQTYGYTQRLLITINSRSFSLPLFQHMYPRYSLFFRLLHHQSVLQELQEEFNGHYLHRYCIRASVFSLHRHTSTVHNHTPSYEQRE